MPLIDGGVFANDPISCRLRRGCIQRLDVDKELLAASWRDRPEHLARLLADVSPAALDMRRQNDHRSRRGIELVVPASNAVEPADDPENLRFPRVRVGCRPLPGRREGFPQSECAPGPGGRRVDHDPGAKGRPSDSLETRQRDN